MAKWEFSEKDVHEHIYAVGLQGLFDPVTFDNTEATLSQKTGPEDKFEFWRVVKTKTIQKLARLHDLMLESELIGSKIKLPIDKSKPMELDMLGKHDDGLFILELKVDKSAERNAFSELFAYSNYIAGIFALSGNQDITNVLIASLDVKITKQAFLYDLLISQRNVIVYVPEFPDGTHSSIRLKLFIPSDDDFQKFANRLLAHDAHSCVVISFHDVPGWIDSEKNSTESLPAYTVKNLGALSSYAAQLMESEGLHGFCFVRKRWKELELFYANSLIICAANPFLSPELERASDLIAQLSDEHQEDFLHAPRNGFDGRLVSIAQRALFDCLPVEGGTELDFPSWNSMIKEGIEVVYTHNLGFRPTGLLREAYVSYLTDIYRYNELFPKYATDVSKLKVREITNWLRAWVFMEMCGFAKTDEADEADEGGLV